MNRGMLRYFCTRVEVYAPEFDEYLMFVKMNLRRIYVNRAARDDAKLILILSESRQD